MAYQTAEISCAATISLQDGSDETALPNHFCFTSFTQQTVQRFLKVFMAKELKFWVWLPHCPHNEHFRVDEKITEGRVRSQNIRIAIILVITPRGPFHCVKCDYSYISDCQHRSAHNHSKANQADIYFIIHKHSLTIFLLNSGRYTNYIGANNNWHYFSHAMCHKMFLCGNRHFGIRLTKDSMKLNKI